MADDSHSADAISSKKWQGISQVQLEALEARQRQRISALEDILQRERQELASLTAARSGGASNFESKYGSQQVPQHYSTELSWKDKILFVVKKAGRPLLGKEIGPILRRLQPYGLNFTNLDNTVSVHLSKLVKDGALVRINRRGRSGSLYALPE